MSDIPAQAPETTIETEPTEQFIASAVDYSYSPFPRALSQWIDDVERDFGYDIYDRMSTDAYAGPAKAYLKQIALNDGVRAVPPIPKPRDGAPSSEVAEYEKAEALAAEVNFALDRLEETDRPIAQTLWDMLDCISHGHRLAEVTYAIQQGGEYDGRLTLDSLVTKPRENYAFVLNKANRLLGVTAKIPGGSQMIWNGLIWDPAKLPSMIAREKICVLRIGGRNNDPRGESLYRMAYDPWYRKQITKTEQLKTAVQFAGGMITIEAQEGAQQPQIDQLLKDAQGLRNGAAMVTKFGAKVTVHRPTGDGSYFANLYRSMNVEILTAIMISARSIMEAEHGAKADTDKSENILDNIRDWLRQLIAQSLSPIARTIIRYNHGDDAVRLAPRFTLAGANRPDLPTTLSAMSSAGYFIAEEQLPEWDEAIGIATKRTEKPQEQAEDENPRNRRLKLKRGGKFDE